MAEHPFDPFHYDGMSEGETLVPNDPLDRQFRLRRSADPKHVLRTHHRSALPNLPRLGRQLHQGRHRRHRLTLRGLEQEGEDEAWTRASSSSST
jgi:hypothetical protein